jgi:hypothetical protein
MVQSELNLGFWFVSYNTFCLFEIVGPPCMLCLHIFPTRALTQDEPRPRVPVWRTFAICLKFGVRAAVQYHLQSHAAALLLLYVLYRILLQDPVQTT